MLESEACDGPGMGPLCVAHGANILATEDKMAECAGTHTRSCSMVMIVIMINYFDLFIMVTMVVPS